MKNYLELKEIEFETKEDKNQTKNYPSNGFYIAKLGCGNELVFIDKNFPHIKPICPEPVLVKLGIPLKILPEENERLNYQEPTAGFVSESFVLDFTKTLLNSKK